METRNLFLILSLFSIIFFSCTKSDIPQNPPPEGGEVSTTVNKTVVLNLVNGYRQNGCYCGTTYMPSVPALTWHSLLEKAALAHAQDMYKNNYFSHTGLNGSAPGDRIAAAGYPWRSYGENIARGYTSEKSVVQGWIQSPGHCMNIMGAQFKEMGMARAGNYWVQELGAR